MPPTNSDSLTSAGCVIGGINKTSYTLYKWDNILYLLASILLQIQFSVTLEKSHVNEWKFPETKILILTTNVVLVHTLLFRLYKKSVSMTSN